jgi:hypothetical protein
MNADIFRVHLVLHTVYDAVFAKLSGTMNAVWRVLFRPLSDTMQRYSATEFQVRQGGNGDGDEGPRGEEEKGKRKAPFNTVVQ